MQFKVEVSNGVATVTDAVTGQILDWVNSVDFVITGGTPVLYLGTYAFSASITAGSPGAPAAPVAAPQAPPAS